MGKKASDDNHPPSVGNNWNNKNWFCVNCGHPVSGAASPSKGTAVAVCPNCGTPMVRTWKNSNRIIHID